MGGRADACARPPPPPQLCDVIEMMFTSAFPGAASMRCGALRLWEPFCIFRCVDCLGAAAALLARFARHCPSRDRRACPTPGPRFSRGRSSSRSRGCPAASRCGDDRRFPRRRGTAPWLAGVFCARSSDEPQTSLSPQVWFWAGREAVKGRDGVNVSTLALLSASNDQCPSQMRGAGAILHSLGRHHHHGHHHHQPAAGGAD